MKRHSRRKNGAALAFGTSLALVIVVLGIGFLAFTMYMGAQNETKNAIDAGALNVARQVIDNISVDLSTDPDQQFFNDVTVNLNGKVNLRNINRVWGKALLVAINSDGADGDNSSGNKNNAGSAQKAAKEISDSLAAKLVDATNLYDYFTQFAAQNSVRMIGNGAQVQKLTGAGWQTSEMDRSHESNLQIRDNLPLNYNLPSAYSTPCTRTPAPQGASGLNFLKGYAPLTAAGNTFWQVPFQFEEKPRLVSNTIFDTNKQPPNMISGNWDKPVPNAFSVEGMAVKTGAVSERALAWAETNPRQTFPMQFPNGFIRVVIKQNTIQWYLEGVPLDSSTYESSPGTDAESGFGIPYPIVPICATASGDATVGNEYVVPTLYMACAGPDQGNFMNYLLQRCKEMLPDTTMNQLTIAMNACIISSDDEDQTFYIYPALGHIIATPDAETVVPLGCDKTAQADCGEQTLGQFGPVPFINWVTETWVCYSTIMFPSNADLTITRKWKPSTGFNGGCLGELTIHHQTDAYVWLGVCSCP